MPRVRAVASCLFSGVAVASAGCAWFETVDPETAFDEPRVHSLLVIVSTNPQTGQANAALPEPLVVRYYRVTELDTVPPDSIMATAPNIVIDWTVEAGGERWRLRGHQLERTGKRKTTGYLEVDRDHSQSKQRSMGRA